MIPFDRLAYRASMREAFECANADLAQRGKPCEPGCVISLDRGYPLVCTPDFEGRAELATSIKKSEDGIVAVGDWVALHHPHGHEKAIIERVLPRLNEIARFKRIGRERQPRRQVLSANVDIVFICQSLTGDGVDEGLLVRQRVAVAGCKAAPVFVLTKGDMADDAAIEIARERIKRIAPDVPLFVVPSMTRRPSTSCAASFRLSRRDFCSARVVLESHRSSTRCWARKLSRRAPCAHRMTRGVTRRLRDA